MVSYAAAWAFNGTVRKVPAYTGSDLLPWSVVGASRPKTARGLHCRAGFAVIGTFISLLFCQQWLTMADSPDRVWRACTDAHAVRLMPDCFGGVKSPRCLIAG